MATIRPSFAAWSRIWKICVQVEGQHKFSQIAAAEFRRDAGTDVHCAAVRNIKNNASAWQCGMQPGLLRDRYSPDGDRLVTGNNHAAHVGAIQVAVNVLVAGFQFGNERRTGAYQYPLRKYPA